MSSAAGQGSFLIRGLIGPTIARPPIVDCLVANVNKTAPEMRIMFDKNGGNLGVQGSVTYSFSHKGDYPTTSFSNNGNFLIFEPAATPQTTANNPRAN